MYHTLSRPNTNQSESVNSILSAKKAVPECKKVLQRSMRHLHHEIERAVVS